MKQLLMLTLGSLALAFLPPAFAQDNEAEKLYRGMEKMLLAAKSYEVAFDYVINKRKAKGELLVANDNKMRLKLVGHFEDKRKAGFELVADGKQLKSKGARFFVGANGQSGVEEGGQSEWESPKDFHKLINGITSRAGVWYTVQIMAYLRGADGDLDLDSDRSKMQAYDFKLGDPEKLGDKETKVIRFRFGDGSKGQGNAEITLWIDAKTQLPLKRSFFLTNDGPRVVETYQFKLDPKIDAKAFELPK